MATVGLQSALYMLFNVALIAVFAMTYMYIEKMERTGCACALHKHRDFVRLFPLFAIVYLVVTLFAPFLIAKSGAFAVAMQVASYLFIIGTVIFYILAIKYVEYLVREKCKCAEDVRREVLYYWSIAHLGLIVLMFVLFLLNVLTSGMVFSKVAAMRTVAGEYGAVSSAVRNPLRNVRNLPAQLKRLSRR